MLRVVNTQDKAKLMELSIKQREMLLSYRQERAERAERERHLDERVTWRDVVRESRAQNKVV